MSAAFTVVLPHKRNPGNDRALAIALDCLMANTVNDFILLMDAAYDAPLFPRVNALVQQATTGICVYTASDMFFAPGWDQPMLEAFTSDTFVTNVVVEPGAIAMHDQNHRMDFGRKPETFRRAEFETWATGDPHFPSGEGWTCPWMFSRTGFWAMGGLATNLPPDTRGFSPADSQMFDRWKAAGNRVVRAKSYVYHLQAFSDVAEQTKEGR